MVKRQIIKIDEEKCNGCGQCIPNCPEGALQMIDGKARLISDLFCDGLGACIGHCPQGAITTEEREAQAYDEKKTMDNIIAAGPNTIKAHLKHLKEHGEFGYMGQAIEVLKSKGLPVPDLGDSGSCPPTGCPGSRMLDFNSEKTDSEEGDVSSQLRQWPVQLHLVSPNAPYFRGKDVVLSADCVAYSLGGFHSQYLKGKSLAIACPKLDSDLDIYVEKIKEMVDEAKINT
ncbi:MAG: 4Fe-4S binding protein, partial [Candidatus Altiarchaeota archaeon]|nr:4Fe-4S binding protein [Candidatus Altiarchaeota archaeon]